MNEIKDVFGILLMAITLVIFVDIEGKGGISKILENSKRDHYIKKINKFSKEENRKLREIKKKNRSKLLPKAIFICILITIIFILVITINLLTSSNIIGIIVGIASPIAYGVSIALVAIWYANESEWYYNLDEYLMKKYQLTQCLNKKEELKCIKNKIKTLKEELKLKKESKILQKKLVQDEEIAIGNLKNEISELKRTNGYKTTAKNDNEIFFEYKLKTKHIRRTPITTYNVECTFEVDKNRLKLVEERSDIFEKYKYLNITISDDGTIKTEFTNPYYEMNYKILANAVVYSYNACISLLK